MALRIISTFTKWEETWQCNDVTNGVVESFDCITVLLYQCSSLAWDWCSETSWWLSKVWKVHEETRSLIHIPEYQIDLYNNDKQHLSFMWVSKIHSLWLCNSNLSTFIAYISILLTGKINYTDPHCMDSQTVLPTKANPCQRYYTAYRQVIFFFLFLLSKIPFKKLWQVSYKCQWGRYFMLYRSVEQNWWKHYT